MPETGLKDFTENKSTSAAPCAGNLARYGVAFDIGTTTVAAALIDLSNGRELASAAAENPQALAGDDVISRIAHAAKDGGYDELRRAMFDCLNKIIAVLCAEVKVAPCSIREATFAGNTAMNHILTGEDVGALGQLPFRTKSLESRTITAGKDFPLNIAPSAQAYTLPNIGGYVGGDTVAMILATGIHHEEKLQLAIDIGTNGEIVLGNREKLIACSTAAGPAFEGARIAFGMRAINGAIDNVEIADDVKVSVIGGGEPEGICGSGIISAVAALLDKNLIEPSGKMAAPDGLPAGLPKNISARVSALGGQPCFVLAQSGEGKSISLTQRDVREVQLGKAAMRAGIELMLAHYGANAEDIETVFVAGTFGANLKPENLIRIGLLPPFEISQIKFAGDAALDGAKMALVSKAKRAESESAARRAKNIDLAGRMDFQTKFSESLFFPEPAK